MKTVRFSNPKYIGDPLNAVRIFNEKHVDELLVLDIDATVMKKEPNYKLISDLAAECRMPLCYGGGVNTAEQIEKIVSLGVEKVAISSAALSNEHLIESAARRVGSQSVVAVLDVKRTGLIEKQYTVFTHNGKKRRKETMIELVSKVQAAGAGEIVINNIDRDGEGCGYDLELLAKVKDEVNIPLTMLGGAGHKDHFREIILRNRYIGLGAGSFFVMTGKYKAVLIQYFSDAEKEELQSC